MKNRDELNPSADANASGSAQVEAEVENPVSFQAVKELQKQTDPNNVDDGKNVILTAIKGLKALLANFEGNVTLNEEELSLKANAEANLKAMEDQLAKLEDFERKQREQFENVHKQFNKDTNKLLNAYSNAGIEVEAEVKTNAVAQVANSFLQSHSKADALYSTQLAGACLQGVLASIPPSFCYKKGGDAGTIPTGCPSGYFRSLALCYEECKDGYKFVAGVCWEKCKSGYDDTGLTCFKWNWFKSKSYGKKTYIPGSITNFSSRIPCPDGKYKDGALCYRDCNNIGLVNCGIGACAASSAACAAGIGQMALDFALGLAQGIAFVASFGTSSAGSTGFAAAKSQLASGFKKLGTDALKNALTTIKRFATKDALKALLKSQTRAAAKKAIKTEVLKAAGTALVETICDSVAETFINKSSASDQVSDLDLSVFDPTGISGAVTACDGAGSSASSNKNAECAKGVLSAVSNFDPTGVTAMAAALIQDTCDV